MIRLQRVQKNVSCFVICYFFFQFILLLNHQLSIITDTASVEAYMDRQRNVQDKGKDLIAQMQSVSESMKANVDKLTGTLVQEVDRQFIISFNK